MKAPLRHILLVEDEPNILAVVQLARKALGGFRVANCASESEALHVAPAFAPDVILLDMMPGLDGPSTLCALREISQVAATPVIFMTAKAQPAEGAQYQALGALDVIAKALATTVSAIWARAHG